MTIEEEVVREMLRRFNSLAAEIRKLRARNGSPTLPEKLKLGELQNKFDELVAAFEDPEKFRSAVERELALGRFTRPSSQARRSTTSRTIPRPATAILSSPLRNTPVAQIQDFIKRAGVQWDNDYRDHAKAYVLACLSELAYLHLSELEL